MSVLGLLAERLRRRQTGPTFLSDLHGVLAERNFRRLFATRLISQTGDGAFTAGISAYVFFNATTFPNPADAAAAFAVLYLPYSMIGPFAGVLIDRWSRRQILVWSALVRASFVAVTAYLVGSGNLGPALYVAVLAVFGVNRFFLSALSAGLPHVVAQDKLVMANAVSPTMGTVVSFIGGLAGLLVHLITGGGRAGSAGTVVAAGAGYLIAGAVAAAMARDLLGPPPLPPGKRRPDPLTEVAMVARGLLAGAQHAWQRRQVATALGAVSVLRLLYGVLLLMSILLYRNYFYPASRANASLGHFTLVVVASAVGYGAAAVITPIATRRLAKQAWVAILLTAAGIITGLLGPAFVQLAFLVIALALGVAAQGVAICATTIIQEQADDSYRGRMFSLYDMLFNVPFVLGAAAAATVVPLDGKSYPLLAVVAGGYLAAASGYALLNRQWLVRPASPDGPASPDAPPPAAQRSNS